MINLLLNPLAHVVPKLFLDGAEYEINHFRIRFSQPTDHKGQPQHEAKGGQIQIVLKQAPDRNLREWAKRSTQLKSGLIVFQTGLSQPVLRVEFEDAYCASLLRDIDEYRGTSCTLIIAPELVKMNDYRHNNNWRR